MRYSGMDTYLSIKDFAAKAGKTQQAIYKQVDKKLSNYIKIVDNQKKVNIRALEEVYGIKNIQHFQPNVENGEQPIQPIIDMLKDELEVLREQLKVKDEQISVLNERLSETNRNLDQAQKLHAIDKQKILELEMHSEPTAEPTEKVNFWGKIFKRTMP